MEQFRSRCLIMHEMTNTSSLSALRGVCRAGGEHSAGFCPVPPTSQAQECPMHAPWTRPHFTDRETESHSKATQLPLARGVVWVGLLQEL